MLLQNTQPSRSGAGRADTVSVHSSCSQRVLVGYSLSVLVFHFTSIFLLTACGLQAPASDFVHVKTNTYIVSYPAPMIARSDLCNKSISLSLYLIINFWSGLIGLHGKPATKFIFFLPLKMICIFFFFEAQDLN